MAELSIETKAKLYDKAIVYAKKLLKTIGNATLGNLVLKNEFENMFPALKENHEEKVKRILHSISSKMSFHLRDIFTEEEFQCFDAWSDIWLEKQAEKDEQKLVNNVELKFKVGDWVVFNNKQQSIYQVDKIEDGYYILRHTHGGTFRVCILHDESLRLWDITKDAKDGDVLTNNGNIILFKQISDSARPDYKFIQSYCFVLTHSYDFYLSGKYNLDDGFHPAYKGLRALLFAKIEEAGYKWDAEKKELKKIEEKPADKVESMFHIGNRVRYKGHSCDGIITEITDTDYICGNAKLPISTQDNLELVEQNLAWSEEDEINRDLLYNALNQVYDMTQNKNLSAWINKRITFCPKQQEWSEEDIEMIDYIASILNSNFNENDKFDDNKPCIGALIDMLKSFKDRIQFKQK